MSNGILRGSLAALVLACTAAIPQSAEAIDTAYSGSWYTPAESGSGFNLEIFSDTRALLFWYVYDDAGQAVWLYSEGTISGETITFIAYYADGMRFSDLDSADKVNRVWGNVTMTFTGCNTATIQYQSTLVGVAHSPAGSGTKQVQRLVNIAGLPCRAKAEGYWAGAHRDPTLNGGAGAYTDLTGVLTGDGRVFLSSLGSEEVFVGEWTIVNGEVKLVYDICPDGEGACVAATGTASFAAKDFVRGTGTSAPWGTQPFVATYRTWYDRKVTLAGLAGAYTLVDDEGTATTVTITANGALSGTNNQGCAFSGQLSQPNADFNLFNYAGTLAGCRIDSWNGVVVNTDTAAGDRKRLEFRLETNTGAMSFVLQKP